MSITLDQAIDSVMQLPIGEQEMLVEIVRNRTIAERRRDLATHAQASLTEFRAGLLRAQTADEIMAELRLATDEQ